MASSRKPEIDSDEEESYTYPDRNANPNPNPVAPLVCVTRFACDSFGGAILGSIIGYEGAGCQREEQPSGSDKEEVKIKVLTIDEVHAELLQMWSMDKEAAEALAMRAMAEAEAAAKEAESAEAEAEAALSICRCSQYNY